MDVPRVDSEKVRGLTVAVGLTIAGFGSGFLLTTLAVLVLEFAGVSVTPAMVLVVWLIMVQGVAFGSTALLYLRWRDLETDFVPVSMPSFRQGIWIMAGYVTAFLSAYGAAVAVTLLFGPPEARNEVANVAIETPEVLLILIPASFLIVGPGEELLFRGIIQGSLRESFSPSLAIVIASGIFASLHFFGLSGPLHARLVVVGILFLPALVFGTIYEKTQNLAVPAIVHGAYNATLFGLLYLVIKFYPEAMEASLLGY